MLKTEQTVQTLIDFVNWVWEQESCDMKVRYSKNLRMQFDKKNNKEVATQWILNLNLKRLSTKSSSTGGLFSKDS